MEFNHGAPGWESGPHRPALPGRLKTPAALHRHLLPQLAADVILMSDANSAGGYPKMAAVIQAASSIDPTTGRLTTSPDGQTSTPPSGS